MRTFALLLAASAATIPTAGWAQDLIVMRRPIAPPNRSGASLPNPGAPTPAPVPTPTPPPAPTWATGDWTWAVGEETCTASATQIRTVTCVDHAGATVADAMCTAARPARKQTGIDRADTCGYAWEQGAWSDEGVCSASSTGTRAVVCRRTDGTAAAASHCAGDAPAATRSGTRMEACTIAWAGSAWSQWAPGCSASSSRTRTVACQASAQGTPPFGVDDALCGGERPSASEGPLAYYGACTGGWTYGAWKATTQSCQHGQRPETMNADCVKPGGEVDASASTCDPTVRPPEQQRQASCAAAGEAMLSAARAPSLIDAAHPLVGSSFSFTVAADGRPAIVRNSDGAVVWTADVRHMTPGYVPGGTIYMQPDGNLVLYNPGSGGAATWHTNTWGAIASYAILTPAGSIEVRHPDSGQVLWRSTGSEGAESHWNPFEGRYVP